MTERLTVDYALCMEETVGAAGLSEADVDAMAPEAAQAVRRLTDEAERDALGFWTLPRDVQLREDVSRIAAGLESELHDILVLGIGGSSLGGRAIVQALAGPVEAPPATDPPRRLHFVDNSDPWLLSALLERLSPATTGALLISKSGGTIETAAQSLVVRDWLERTVGKDGLRQRVVVVTDPQKGPLRELATAERLWSLPIPPNVGGRFSVLSAVGLLPAALAGVDISALQRGAQRMAQRCGSPELRDNPAAMLAAAHVLHHRLKNRAIHVLMPYSDQLRAFAAWFVQLWAESLGKRHDRAGNVVERGPTPLPAVGATDQHAQMQLFMEGPRDKLITFLHIEEPERDLTIPSSDGAFAYLGGASLGQLLQAEFRSTAQALAHDARPSLTVRAERLDAETLGALFFLFEAATAIAGELYDIDAFVQPGVEEAKRLAFGLLGRPGYEDAARDVRQAEATGARHEISM